MSDDQGYVNLATVQHVENELSTLYFGLTAAAGVSQDDAKNLVRKLDDIAGKLASKAHSLQMEALEAERHDKSRAADLRERAHALSEKASKLRFSSGRVSGAASRVNTVWLGLMVCQPSARHFLREVQEDLRNYQAYTLEESSAAAGIAAAGSGGSGARVEVAAPDVSAATALAPPMGVASPDSGRYKLPKGFVWFRLDNIAATPEFALLEWGAVSQAEMRRWFSVLEKEVLEIFETMGTGRRSDYFRALDNRKGATYENGVQRVYDAFFGDAPIMLSGGESGETFKIENGVHRIAVARRLAWEFVPVKIHEQAKITF